MNFEIGTLPLVATMLTILVTGAALYGWQGWLALKARELDLKAGPVRSDRGDGTAPAAARIELADLKERVRQLEAIASGVDP